ncbi:hypothetical protein HDV04_004412 [Boothiomyces sp. JEL0838]|nr:hypothetical protein HDV04_004412 [Boothiomyces sp. JEL0838]
MLVSLIASVSVVFAQSATIQFKEYTAAVGTGYNCYGVGSPHLVSITQISPNTAIQYFSDYGCQTIINTHTMQPQHWTGNVPQDVANTNVYSVKLIQW